MKFALSVISATLAIAGSVARAQGNPASEGLTESFQAVPLARGGNLPVLVNKRVGTSPTVAVLLFPGYPGVLKIRNEDGAIKHGLGGNFLVRARRFLNTDKVFTVMVDCPVDQWNLCGDAYRQSNQHAADISDVVAAVRALGAQQVYIVGTSYGTVSTAVLARSLGGKVDGTVHTATFTDPGLGRDAHGSFMRNFDWSQAKMPQLFVHHRDDPCRATRYAAIADGRKDIPLVTVEGVANARGEPCEAFSAHGFVGRERTAMNAIHDWVIARKVTPVVGSKE